MRSRLAIVSRDIRNLGQPVSGPAQLLLVWAILFTLVAVACDRLETPTDPVSTDSTPPPVAASPVRVSRDQEQAIAEKVGAVIAAALQDPQVREDLYYAISRSTHHEGKIELGTLLEKPIGKRLETAAMLALEQDVSQLLAALPSLELYLPVDEHRRAWFGGDPIRVAVGVHEEDGILRAFSADGTSELLDTDTPPSDPILVVTKSETDFSQISFPDDRGIPARTSSMITGSEIVFGDSCATYQVADTIPGLYMFCNEIYDDHDLHEPFYRGDPEIEVHFFHEADSVYADFSSYCVGPVRLHPS